MSGIIGYVGTREAAPILLDGLHRRGPPSQSREKRHCGVIMPLKTTVPTLLVAALLAFIAPCGAGQQPNSDAYRMQATRPELEATLERLRELARSPSRAAWLAADTTYIRTRLEQGDFHVGDRVLLSVEDPLPLRGTGDHAAAQGKSQEQQLSDTFTVGVGQELVLPVVGTVSLRGVLRSELEPALARAIAGYIKDPVMRARSLVSVGVTGEVARPGYYSVPPDAVLSAVLTTAGGPTKDAKLKKLTLERDGRALLEGKALGRAIARASTLDELQVRSGDQLVVPSKNHGDLYEPLRFIAVLLSIPVTIYTLTHLR